MLMAKQQAVYDVFDEFQNLLKNEAELHPSEEVNRDFELSENSSDSVYDIINGYHVYCVLCHKHFYSKSVFNDINSFFQKHINTDYHVSSKLVSEYPKDKPIIEWVKWLYSGRCNICEMETIYAYVVNSVVTPLQLASYHTCHFEKNTIKINPVFLKKVEILRKYCRLNFFLEKIIKVVDDNNVICLLCSKKMPVTKKSAQYHLAMFEHFQSFLKVVWNKFNFKLKDLFNGFNLELVTEWFVSEDMEFLCGNVEFCNDKMFDLKKSNNVVHPYCNIQSNSGFSPKYIQDLIKIQPADIISNETCLICNVSGVSWKHELSAHHLKNLSHANSDTFDCNNKYQLFLNNLNKRLLPHFIPVMMYLKLVEELKVLDLTIGIPYTENLNEILLQPKKMKNTNEALIEGFLKHEIMDHNDSKVNKFDFDKFRKSLESLMDIFEIKIKENVENNSKLLFGKLNISKTEEKDSRKSNASDKENTPDNSQTSKSKPPAVDSTESQSCRTKQQKQRCTYSMAQEDFVQIANSIRNVDNEKKISDEIKDLKTDETENEVEENEVYLNEEHEVLVIKGLYFENNFQPLYSMFKKYGKIEYLFFNSDIAYVAFKKKKLAEKIAKGPDIFYKDKKLDLSFTTRVVKSKYPESDQIKPLDKDLADLLRNHQSLLGFAMQLNDEAKSLRLSSFEIKREYVVCSEIIAAVIKLFPFSKCYPFGSRLSGLSLKNSDLDVFLDIGGMYEEGNSGILNEKNLNEIAQELRKKFCSQIVVVKRARVPIISFCHNPTGIFCDLSFRNGLGVQNTRLLKFILTLDWRISPIILFLKKWANVNAIHGPPYFSSYGIALLVIFYLQQLSLPILPPIETFQKNFVGPRLTIEGWDCNFSTDLSLLQKTENKETIPKLLEGFFKFYANYDYKTYIICPLLGQPIQREAFMSSTTVKLPMGLKRHIHNVSPPIENLVSKQIPICLMDPFDLSHILTKCFSKRGLQLFIHYCQQSASNIKKGFNLY